ncbi:MAG: ABC-F family ATP-binding cassette domain-containing protein [Pseudomonadota bacterium]
MLHINDLTYRIEGRTILENATAAISTGHKVGLVGRNGTGKSTLLKLIIGDLSPETGGITMMRGASLGHVAQEAPGGDVSIIDWVLSADTERAALLDEAETASDPTRIADIQIRLADIGAHHAPARAAQILAGLGFDEATQQRPCSAFSGGWRMRVALAAVLFLEPDVLLLDEPTNYLDLEGTLWLESYLRSYPHTVLIVSHDRDLLNNAVAHILHLERGQLSLYAGGYDRFERTRRERQRLDLKLKKKQDDERRRIQAFVDRFRAQANKATQAQSRLKALARMEPIAAQVEDRVVPFQFEGPQRALASPLIRFEAASVGYAADAPILTGLDLRLDADDRIGLLGANGNGKSTFAKLLAGRLQAGSGRRIASDKMRVGYFAQHQLDDLPAGQSPYDHMVELMPEETEAKRRARLGTFGFPVEKADTVAAKLSGGERARLLLALATFHRPHLIILDEPTNHLDVDSREALVQALATFEGAVILISHDRHLIEASCDRLWLVDGGSVRVYDEDMAAYRKLLLDQRSQRGKGKTKGAGEPRTDARSQDDGSKDGGAGAAASGGNSKADRAQERRLQAERRAALAPLRQAVQAEERTMSKLTASIARHDEALADVSLYDRAPEKAQKLVRERGRLAKELSEAEERWLTASAAVEEAEQAHV